jgi:type VI secretion system protein ImpL
VPTPPASASGSALDERVRRLYLQAYVGAWDAYLSDVRLVRLGGLQDSLAVARVLAAPDSPLPAYLRAAARETQLAAQAGAEATAADATAGTGTGTAKLEERTAKARQDIAAVTGAQPGIGAHPAGAPLESMVDDHFQALHRLVAGSPAPIDEVGRQFNDVFGLLGAIDAARRSRSAPPPAAAGIGATARAAAALQPEPVRSMLESLADVGVHQGRHAERRSLDAELRPLAEFCARTIAGRYPFAPTSTSDVLPEDFGQLFGMGGLFDDFTQLRLAALIDTTRTPWTYKPLPDGSRSPGGAALAEFQRAARIRDVFFRQGGKTPGFKVDLRVTEMAPGQKDLTLDIDGQVIRFTAGDTSAQTVSWPSGRVASRIRLAAGDGAARTFDGPWALFRLLGAFEVQPSPQPERFTVVINLEGRSSKLEVTSNSAINPLRMRELSTFRCPDRL